MEIDQFKKQLDWLDEERRKDKLLIATLQDRIADLEERIPPVDQRIGGLEGELAHITTSLTRFEQIENTIGQMRVELSRQVQDVEKARAERDREMEKVRLAGMELFNRNIGGVRKNQDPPPELKKALLAPQEGENRLGTEIEEMGKRLTPPPPPNEEN